MILGIGNPLVAIYARCYLCRVGLNVMTRHSETGYLRRNFECFLETYQHVRFWFWCGTPTPKLAVLVIWQKCHWGYKRPKHHDSHLHDPLHPCSRLFNGGSSSAFSWECFVGAFGEMQALQQQVWSAVFFNEFLCLRHSCVSVRWF